MLTFVYVFGLLTHMNSYTNLFFFFSDMSQIKWCPFHSLQKCQGQDINGCDLRAVSGATTRTWSGSTRLYQCSWLHAQVRTLMDMISLKKTLSIPNYTPRFNKAEREYTVHPSICLSLKNPKKFVFLLIFFLLQVVGHYMSLTHDPWWPWPYAWPWPWIVFIFHQARGILHYFVINLS